MLDCWNVRFPQLQALWTGVLFWRVNVPQLGVGLLSGKGEGNGIWPLKSMSCLRWAIVSSLPRASLCRAFKAASIAIFQYQTLHSSSLNSFSPSLSLKSSSHRPASSILLAALPPQVASAKTSLDRCRSSISTGGLSAGRCSWNSATILVSCVWKGSSEGSSLRRTPLRTMRCSSRDILLRGYELRVVRRRSAASDSSRWEMLRRVSGCDRLKLTFSIPQLSQLYPFSRDWAAGEGGGVGVGYYGVGRGVIGGEGYKWGWEAE